MNVRAVSAPAAGPPAARPSNVVQRMEVRHHGGGEDDGYNPSPDTRLTLPNNFPPKPPTFKDSAKVDAIREIVGESAWRTQPNEVLCLVKITCNKVEIYKNQTEDTNNPRPPYTKGTPHVHDQQFAEMYFSRGDAEASLLPAAEDMLFPQIDLVAGDESDAPVQHHMVTLVGPYGPCNGCRTRMELFRQRWMIKARESRRRLKLTLSYYYANGFKTYGNPRKFSLNEVKNKEIQNRFVHDKLSTTTEYTMPYGVRDEVAAYHKPSKNEKSLSVNWYKTTAYNR
jgi:hypothetical protein